MSVYVGVPGTMVRLGPEVLLTAEGLIPKVSVEQERGVDSLWRQRPV